MIKPKESIRLESVNRFLRQLSFVTGEAMTNLRRSGWMTWVVVSTMVVSLSVLGGFWLLLTDLQHIGKSIGSQVEVWAFLRDGTSPGDMSREVAAQAGVTRVTVVTKDEAWASMKEELKNQMDFSHLDSVNPLPDALKVRVATPQDAPGLVEKLKVMAGVEEVRYSESLIRRLQEIGRAVRVVGGVIILILSVATLAIVVNTIRLAVNARRNEIEIMRLVGAPNWIVKFPFLLEGVLFGLISVLLSAGLLYGWRYISLRQVENLFAFLPISHDYWVVMEVSGYLALVGIALGGMGSLFSVRRYLGRNGIRQT